jgi:hypothetical protein
MLAITLDLDWAPDGIVDEVISVMDRHKVPATLFCTNYLRDRSKNSSSLSGRFDARHEIALHPNFQQVGDYESEWDDMVKLYPQAKGWRSHNGVSGWPILKSGFARGLRYEVLPSVFSGYVEPSPVNRALKGYYAFTTAFWDSHMLHEPGFSWRAADLPLRELFEDERKVVVLGFHPNILYYDMRLASEYDARKSSYHVVDERASHRHRRLAGAMRLLMEIFDTVPPRCFTNLTTFGANAGFW